RIVCIYYTTSTFFKDENNSKIWETVLGAAVKKTTLSNLKEPVQITFEHGQLAANVTPKCVFWDLKETDDRGSWNDSGCNTTTDGSRTVCECNHLTYFALLMQVTKSPLEENILKSLMYITYIGCGISVCSTLTFIILHFFTRRLLPDHSTKIHAQLAVALFLLNMTFLLSLKFMAFLQDGLCIAFAAVLHFSLLSTFTWMGIEGFHLYMLLIRVYNTYVRHYIVKLGIVGWGLPTLVVTLILILKSNAYGSFEIETTQHKNASMCWIKDPVVHYATNVIYFGFIFLCNTTLLLFVVGKILKLKSTVPVQRKIWKDISTVLGLSSMLGITWGLAFFSFGPLLHTLLYLFTILNSLQGFFLLLWVWALRRQPKKEASPDTNTTQTLQHAA
uniref:Adhesion G protein-coupled receptor G3 n=1 Tax=Latimeria chalumnae TaxID=7897 RepID=H3A2A6_LATCH